MSISFPKTWTSERLDAQDVRSNLDAMKNKQQKLLDTDMQRSLPWIDTHHLMQGRYTTTTNMTDNNINLLPNILNFSANKILN